MYGCSKEPSFSILTTATGNDNGSYPSALIVNVVEPSPTPCTVPSGSTVAIAASAAGILYVIVLSELPLGAILASGLSACPGLTTIPDNVETNLVEE